MPPASPDPRAAIDAVLEPLREETDRIDRELASNRAFLQERRARGVDAETRDLLARAATSPAAPDSLRRLARRVAAGELTWDDVFTHRAGPDGTAFLGDAVRTAREHFAEVEVEQVRVPDQALDLGVDPEEVSDDIFQALVQAHADHDAVFRHRLEDRP